MALDSVWTLRGREKFLPLLEIKPRFLGPAAGILVTVLNVLHNGRGCIRIGEMRVYIFIWAS